MQCISNLPQTKVNIENNIIKMNQSLPQTFKKVPLLSTLQVLATAHLLNTAKRKKFELLVQSSTLRKTPTYLFRLS
jgi:hypothetical protein